MTLIRDLYCKPIVIFLLIAAITQIMGFGLLYSVELKIKL